MEHAGVKAAKCDPSEVSDSRRASVLQLCARLPLICCQHHSALLCCLRLLGGNSLQDEPHSWLIVGKSQDFSG